MEVIHSSAMPKDFTLTKMPKKKNYVQKSTVAKFLLPDVGLLNLFDF